MTFNIDSYFNIYVLINPTFFRKKQNWVTRWTILCRYSTCWLPQFKHCLFGFNGLEWMLWLCHRKMWPSSFQITAQSGAVHRHWGFPISEGEKDTGVEYEPGACDVKIEWRGKHKRSSWFAGWSLSTCGSKALDHGANNGAAIHQQLIFSHIGSDLSSLQTYSVIAYLNLARCKEFWEEEKKKRPFAVECGVMHSLSWWFRFIS